MIQRIGGGLLSSHVRIMAALACVSALGLNSARAESEFEYGCALIERSAPDFSTQDLVERLIAKLDANAGAAAHTDATLLKAILKRRLAQNASIAARATLLAEAEKLYAEVLAGPRTYANYTFAERDEATLDFDCVKALKKGATEDPAQSAKLMSEAAAVMAKVAQKYRAQSDALYPEFQRCWNILKVFLDHNDIDNPKPLPAGILDPLNKAFAAWVDPDQRFIAASVEQLDCLPDKDPAKKALAADLLIICGARNADEKLGDQAITVAWYGFMEGRVHAINLDEAKADEAWVAALNIETQAFSVEKRNQFFAIQKLILRERVKLKMALHHYSEVVEMLSVSDMPPNLFSDDSGKEILAAYTRALTKTDDADGSQFERAIRTLQAMIVREDNAGSAWSAEFAGAIAETVAGARGKHLPLKLRAAEWSSAARGFMLKAEDAYRRYEELQHNDAGNARPQFDAAAAEYESAAECLRSAISAARKESPAARMKIESKAWLSLSRCYLRTHNYLEAVVACQAMLGTFGQKNRSWLPDPAKAANRDVKDALPELDTLVKQGAETLEYAKRVAIRFHPNTIIDLEPGSAGDNEYSRARAKMELAASLEKAAGPPTEIVAAFTAAADLFAQVKPGSPNYEAALFQCALAWTSVQDQYATGKLPGRPEDMQAKARDFAARALAAFQKYEEAVAHTAAASESVTQQRESRRGTLLLLRSSLCLAAGEWIRAADTVDEFMAWLRQNPASHNGANGANGADGALRNKFRALMELSAAKDAPDSDNYAKDAADCMNAWKSAATKNDAVYQYMLARLSRRYDALATDAAKRGLAGDAVKACNEKVADFEELRVASLKAGAPVAGMLSEYSYLFWTLHRAGRAGRAIDVGKELLETFDPKGAGANIPDDEKPWQAMLIKMIGEAAGGKRGIVRYDDLAKWDRCKQDHTLLVDFMYDTVSGAQYPNGDAHRPAFDRFNVDNERALAQIQTIRRNYPDCATLKPELGENGKSYLAIIEDEIDFRRKIASARALLLDLVIGKGDELTKGNHEDEAKPYLELASNLLQVEIAKGNDSLDLKLKKAKLDATIGKYDEALKALFDIRAGSISDTVIYFEASKLMSIVFARKNKWKDAAEFPEFIANIIGFDSQRVRERWPDMKEFLEECKKHEQK